MLTKVTFILANFLILSLNAQTLSQTVISSSGDHFQNGTASLSWTLGEPIINSLENGSARLSQGFHQPYLTVSQVSEYETTNPVRVYPNPSSAMLNIEFSNSGEYQVELLDILGRILQSYEIRGNHIELDLNDLPAANYMIR